MIIKNANYIPTGTRPTGDELLAEGRYEIGEAKTNELKVSMQSTAIHDIQSAGLDSPSALDATAFAA